MGRILHDKETIESYETQHIMRRIVPGGWIYTTSELRDYPDRICWTVTSSVFVPYDNEFEDKKD